MMYPLVTDLADEGIPVALTCRVLGFSKQGYFKWRAKPICDRDLSDAYLINDAIDAHQDDPGFGYRFISDELEALGHVASENRVQRLCSLQRIWSVHSKKRGTGRRPGPPVHDDLVQRNFTATAINTLWLTDISEHPTARGQALSLRRQGRLLDSDRRVFHGCSHAGLPRGQRSQQRPLYPRRPRRDRPQRQGVAIPLSCLRTRPQRRRAAGLDGKSRDVCRQRGHGIIFRPAAKERAQLPAMEDARRTASRHRHVDREDLQPPPASAWTRETHAS